jgi:CRP-like cAMP-binding protein
MDAQARSTQLEFGAGGTRLTSMAGAAHPGDLNDTRTPLAGAAGADALLDAHHTLLGPVGTFLPERVPVIAGLPEPFAAFRAAMDDLPEHYQHPGAGVRGWLDGLFGRSDPDVLAAVRAADVATKAGLFGVLTILVHTHRWDTAPPAAARFAETELLLPEGIRAPWAGLCDEAGLPHVGTAWSFLMCNWSVPGREGAEYDAGSLPETDLRLGCEWLRPPADSDVENFNLAFVCVEAKGAPATALAVDAVAAAQREDAAAATDALAGLAEAIDDVTSQFVERIRATRVALNGWLDLVQPTFGWGLLGHDGQPLSGPGGMQLGTLHVLNAVLGVPAGSTIAKATLASRRYIPTRPREFLAVLDRFAPRLGEFVFASGRQDLKRAFNDALRALRRFRVGHRVQGARYLRAGGQEGAPRLSSGTGISWREDPSRPEIEPADLFERQMMDRIVETTDALAPGAGEPHEVRAPETAFRLLDRRQLRTLLEVADRRPFPAGSVIIAAGARSEAMYLLLEGTASVVAASVGAAAPIARLWPGELFGELSFLGAVPSRSVVADSDVVVDVLSSDAVHSILESDTALAAAFYRSLAVLVARRLNEKASSVGWAVPLNDTAAAARQAGGCTPGPQSATPAREASTSAAT